MERGRSQEKKTISSPSLKRHHHNEISKSNGIHIPIDPTVDILSRLQVKSLVRFQIVSKLWSSLIIDSIVARSFTQPRLHLIFPHWLLQTSLLSSALTNNYIDVYTLARRACHGTCCDYKYQYMRGLICSKGEVVDTVKPGKRYKAFIPETKHSSCDKFLGYYPRETYRVFTLFGGLKKQQWKRLNIQGTMNHDSPKATSSGLCINGAIYYIASREFNELVGFDLRCERFDHIKMPITLQMSGFKELVLVNYKGKLGCIRYNKDGAEMWIMEDHNNTKEREWSKIVLCMPDSLLKSLGYSNCIAGVTPNGEIVIMPMTLFQHPQWINAYYYDPKEKKTSAVIFETLN